MAPKTDKDLENLHEQWLSDPLLKDAAKLRLDILSAMDTVNTVEEKIKRDVSNPLKQSNAKKTLAEIQKVRQVLENTGNDLHNLMTAAQPLGSTSGFPRVRPEDFKSRVGVITFRGREDLKMTNNKDLDQIITDVQKKMTSLEKKSSKELKKKKL